MTVIVGKVLDRLGHATWLESRPDPVIGFTVTRTCGGQPLRLRSSQAARIPVDVGHDAARLVGEVRHLEANADGDTWAVADINRPLPPDAKLYFSADVVYRDADDVTLRAVGVTANPAMVNLPAVDILAGVQKVATLDDNAVLRLRRVDPHLAGLLERARAAARTRRPGAPLVVHDLRPPARDRGVAVDADGAPLGNTWVDWNGRACAGPGMRHGQPGRVLAVR